MRGIDDKGQVRSGWALAALVFGLAAPLAYIAQRLVDHVVIGPVDPLSMLREARVAFVWRSATAAFWGGLASLVVLTLHRAGVRALTPNRASKAAALIAAAFVVFAWILP